MDKCKKCGRPIQVSQKRNKDGELPYEVHIEISDKNIKEINKGHKLFWFIHGKRKMGYCEIRLEKVHKRKGVSKND